MKVAFNARVLRDPAVRGWTRYTVNLIRELIPLGIRPLLYTDRALHPSHLESLPADSFEVRVAPPMRYLAWEQVWLREQCGRDGVDLLHCTFNFGLPWSAPCPKILTLHDAIDFIYYPRFMTLGERLRRGWWSTRFHHWIARKRADAVITVSEHAKRDLVRFLGLPTDQITVIYEAADSVFSDASARAERSGVLGAYGLSKPYFFYVGGFEQRKNLPFLIRAFSRANLEDAELVLAGAGGAARDRLESVAAEVGVAGRIRWIGRVEDRELPALYGGALAFVYPSEYEGFGLQLCEAMACGCPLLVSDAGSLPEIAGAAADVFPLSDAGPLVSMLEKMYRDPAYRAAASARSSARAETFSWRRTAEETLSLYRRVSTESR